MLTSDDKVGGWVKKGQNHDDVILEWSLRRSQSEFDTFENQLTRIILKCPET